MVRASQRACEALDVGRFKAAFLPWGIRLPEMMANPELDLGLLEGLYDGPSDRVRRSVSNHLDDFSKVQPGLVVETLEKWRGEGATADTFEKLSRHASRTLLEQGHLSALKPNGYGEADAFVVEHVSVKPARVRIRKIGAGERIEIRGFHLFKPVTTRRSYAGIHRFELRINGKASLAQEFEMLI